MRQSTGAVIVYTSEGDELADGSKAIRSLFDMHSYASKSIRIGTTRRNEGKSTKMCIFSQRFVSMSCRHGSTKLKNANGGSFLVYQTTIGLHGNFQ